MDLPGSMTSSPGKSLPVVLRQVLVLLLVSRIMLVLTLLLCTDPCTGTKVPRVIPAEVPPKQLPTDIPLLQRKTLVPLV